MLTEKYRLGLDLGTNSIGWAMLALNKDNQPFKIIDAGARIFSDGRNPKSKEPLAVARRVARGARRRRDRFLARKTTLMNYLIKTGLMPQDEVERKKLELLNPYELRTKALYESLKAHELGRAIFHLNQRRGFKSNRKETGVDEKTKSKNKDDQEGLKKKIQETNSKSLGEFFYKERLKNELTTRAKPNELGLYPTRDLYEEEFEKIKNFQEEYQKISAEDWKRIREIIFHQRPLRAQEKGACQLINQFQDLPAEWQNILNKYRLENKSAKGLPRAYLALPSYQRFRILSEVNNLKIIDPNKTKINLLPQEKQAIIDILKKQKSCAFSQLRKEITTKENNYETDDFEFNLEIGEKRKSLKGDETSYSLSKKEYFGKNWFDLPLEKQDEIVEFILDAENSEKIRMEALEKWGLSQENAENISVVDLKSGIGNLSKEILRKLVAKIEEKYCRYDEAVKEILGFSHSNSKTLEEIEKQPIHQQLEYYGKILQTSTMPIKVDPNKPQEKLSDEEKYGKIANPTVHVALNQLRKVVNELLKIHGNPEEITVELARDLKLSKKDKIELEKSQTKNQKENEKVDKILEEHGQQKNYTNRLKYKLWEELARDPNERKCIFSGNQISVAKLFSSEVEIEHILPFSKTFDDSYKNKTLAISSANRNKGNKSPYEAFGNSSANYDYEAIKARVENLQTKNKKWRFYPDAMEKFNDESGFIAKQLNDTRYLSKIATQYLSYICKPNKISIANGQLTALLRHNWGLNSILNRKNEQENVEQVIENLEVASEEKNNDKKVKKTREDHRHHAVDAVVVGMTSRSLLQDISRKNSINYDLNKVVIPLPAGWNRFYEDTKEAIEKIIVSHKPNHKINTQLHDETYYGLLKKPIILGEKQKKYRLVSKVKIGELKIKEIPLIIDNTIKKDLQELAKSASGDKNFQEKILPGYSKSQKIKGIRIYDDNNSIIKIHHPARNPKFTKIIKTNGNHHVSLWKLPNGQFLTDVVSSFKMKSIYEIKKDADGINFVNKEKKFLPTKNNMGYEDMPNYEKLKPHPAAKLLIRLSVGDLVKIEENGIEKIIRITVVSANTQCYYLDHNLTIKNTKTAPSFSLNERTLLTKKLRKIFITETGKVFDSGQILKTE